MRIIRPKPRVLRDLYSPAVKNRFSKLNQRVDLVRQRVIKIPLISVAKALTVTGVFSYLVFGSVLAPVGHNQFSLAAQNVEERQALEKQLAELEAQMDEYESTIDRYRSEGKNLQGEIGRLNAQINKLNLQIKAINLSLQRLNEEIDVNKKEIVTTEDKIDQNREVLSRSLQQIYENGNISVAEILLRRPRLSDFFSDVSDLLAVQEGMRATLEKVVDLRVELLDEQEALAIKRADTSRLKAFQDAQKSAIAQNKEEKNNLLTTTKGNEQKFQSLLKETQKTAAQIRNRLFEFIGGGSLTFENAYAFAKFAEQATGIRAAMVLAVLDRESSFGENVGRCSYGTAMHPTRDLPIFLALLADLKSAGKAPPEPVLVSCAISRHGAFCGAMGPAQFIPSTWNIYKDKIADITGSAPASPWNNADAFAGTALYLKDAYESSSCRNYAEENKNVLPKQALQERCAAAKYYAGGNWYRYRFFYGDPVVERANKFEKDIAILNG